MTLRLSLSAILLAACSSGGGGYYYGPQDSGTGADLATNHPGDFGNPQNSDLSQPNNFDMGNNNGNCGDGVKNGQETGVDCGGPQCGKCPVGQGCNQNSDCQDAMCSAGKCQAAANCNDGIKDGQETDVDCGGGTCPACENGGGCVQNSDCVSVMCQNNMCQASATCNDGIQNGQETDVDCGGPMCGACQNGQRCLVGGDCSSNGCCSNLCVDRTSDGLNCGACGKACAFGQTCVNSVCTGGGQKVMVGMYNLPTGPAWAQMPVTYSCVEACAMLFGAGNYSCSTTANALNQMAAVVCYGTNGCPVHPDSYKLGATYIQGSCSAYIDDGACPAATNYCWR